MPLIRDDHKRLWSAKVLRYLLFGPAGASAAEGRLFPRAYKLSIDRHCRFGSRAARDMHSKLPARPACSLGGSLPAAMTRQVAVTTADWFCVR